MAQEITVNTGNLTRNVRAIEHADGSISIVAVSAGTRMVEPKTHLDAANGVITFDEPVDGIAIVNTSGAPGVFTVNGLEIRLEPGQAFGPMLVGYNPNAEVTVTGASSYSIGRCV